MQVVKKMLSLGGPTLKKKTDRRRDQERERSIDGHTKPNMQKGQKKERKKFSNNLANVLLCQTSANSALKAK